MMKFSNYLQEEYFMRVGAHEIFMNPSPKEVSSIYTKDKSLRALADFDNEVLFVFDSDLLHQSAIINIKSEYDDGGIFFCIEVYKRYIDASTVINFTKAAFKIVDNKAMNLFRPFDKENNKNIKWFLSFFKHLPDFENPDIM